MLWRRFRALTSFLVVGLLALGPVTAHAQTERDVENAKDDVAYTEARKTRAFQDWETARLALESAIADYEEVNAEREALTYTIAQLSDRIIEYEGEVSALRDRARELVIDAYTSGNTGLIGAAFNAGTIQELLTSQVLIDKAAGRDIAQLDRFEAIRRDMERLKANKADQEATVRELETQAEVLVEEMADFDAAAEAAYQRADDAVRDAIDRYEREVAEFEVAEAQRRARQAAAARNAASGAAAGLPPEVTPNFLCPVAGSPSFINSWGFARSGGRRHKGVDMFDPRGTALVAVVDGYIKLRTVSLGGIVTYLYGDDGNLYYYAHLDGYPSGLSDGQRVTRGQQVGLLGSTGNARYTSPHLHFEIRPGYGSAVNPYPTVRYYC
jgi:peptidoglycan LD-endopeptidase LytH